METPKIHKVVVAGGGTAGWMAAAALSKLLGKTLDITLIESDEIGTVGVGEATIPTLITLHELLQIKEQDFVSAVQGTFKLGISFENWRDVGEDYIHSFGYTGKDCWAAGFQHFWLKGHKMGISEEYGEYCTEWAAAKDNRFAVLPNSALNYAYHFDASLYAKFLRGIAEDNGAVRQEGKIKAVEQHPETGFITGVMLESGQLIEGDFFVDCTGFRGLLIEQTLHTGYDDWSHWLPADSAVAVQTESVAPPIPYTRSIAHEAGWQWRIPLQHRVGNGMVFCSKFWSDDEATSKLLGNVEGPTVTDPRVIKFTTGSRRKHWNKNVVAMGLASGFMEPLESTSIHLAQRAIIRLMQMFPYDGVRQPDVEEFNNQMKFEIENIRDFIVLHYHVTNRRDTAFWRHCSSMPIPDSLQHRIELFKQAGRVFKVPTELFGENSWTQVMLGQGLMPEQYHPIVNMMSDDELKVFLSGIHGSVGNLVRQLPSHQRFIDHYCKAMPT
ncbi:MAG: tryptophan 7-halogenase [Gammaproteobacteria bacterium]|jgi:tryptophan halogenase|nr:tryptophan 7-halogenase [Gammaproteobacteria bacterium]MBT3695536.1 tryptophan 7-halogenase [Gammaproteobacteria bacterium]MBT5332645.1 tryptophan 7-halogenase [Gammaproteobacteria bacterium]MBT5681162.1 tryptophan 7-halogenase [Gammaproteobacteria bacterium]MBT6024388.1 tryptophan 7-halogenase [Gammaproteobacteria bacterium]